MNYELIEALYFLIKKDNNPLIQITALNSLLLYRPKSYFYIYHLIKFFNNNQYNIKLLIHYIKNVGILGIDFIKLYPDTISFIVKCLNIPSFKLKVTACKSLRIFGIYSKSAFHVLKKELFKNQIPSQIVAETMTAIGPDALQASQELISRSKIDINVNFVLKQDKNKFDKSNWILGI